MLFGPKRPFLGGITAAPPPVSTKIASALSAKLKKRKCGTLHLPISPPPRGSFERPYVKRSLFIAAALFAAAESSVASPQDGWDGAGWYVSSNAAPSDGVYRPGENIMFRGPIGEEHDCMTIYIQLYSPIGGCHFFRSKLADRVEEKSEQKGMYPAVPDANQNRK